MVEVRTRKIINCCDCCKESVCAESCMQNMPVCIKHPFQKLFSINNVPVSVKVSLSCYLWRNELTKSVLWRLCEIYRTFVFFWALETTDSIKKSHYMQDLLANWKVKLRFEGRDEQRLRAQNKERLDEKRRNRSSYEKQYDNTGEEPKLVRHFKKRTQWKQWRGKIKTKMEEQQRELEKTLWWVCDIHTHTHTNT